MGRLNKGATIQSCYSTWSGDYYERYYGDKASYPPVHRELLKREILETKARTLLDAGCGPASFLRELVDEGIELYGFDLTPEMVAEARRILQARGIAPGHIWRGSVLSRKSFQMPGSSKAQLFDAAICIGVLPHVPERADITVIRHLREAVKKNGLVIIEARNQLFSLTSLNRYSYEFFIEKLIRVERLKKRAGRQGGKLERVVRKLQDHFRMDLPPIRKGASGRPGYDEVLSRTHNPLVLKAQFAAAGFTGVRVLFYHYHCLPPMFEAEVPELFRSQSLAMEDPDDWRGYFMASAFLVAGTKS